MSRPNILERLPVGRNPGDPFTENQGMDVVRAFVSKNRFEIAHVTSALIFISYSTRTQMSLAFRAI